MTLQFSIITPSLNYGEYVKDCVESVLSQSEVTLEHIIIDGLSSDQTLELLANYGHLRVLAEPDGGMSDAINKGFDMAKGEWVMWLNMDDRLKPGALATIWEYFLKNKNLDVIHGTCDFVDANGGFLNRYKSLPYNNFIHIHQNHYIPSTATFFRRETILDKSLRVDPRFRITMDKEFLAKLYAMGKRFGYLPVSIADFRLHGTNLSKKPNSTNAMDDQFLVAKLGVEAEAIRRVYGFTLTPNMPWLVKFMDCILYFIASVYKNILRLPYSHVGLPIHTQKPFPE